MCLQCDEMQAEPDAREVKFGGYFVLSGDMEFASRSSHVTELADAANNRDLDDDFEAPLPARPLKRADSQSQPVASASAAVPSASVPKPTAPAKTGPKAKTAVGNSSAELATTSIDSDFKTPPLATNVKRKLSADSSAANPALKRVKKPAAVATNAALAALQAAAIGGGAPALGSLSAPRNVGGDTIAPGESSDVAEGAAVAAASLAAAPVATKPAVVMVDIPPSLTAEIALIVEKYHSIGGRYIPAALDPLLLESVTISV